METELLFLVDLFLNILIAAP